MEKDSKNKGEKNPPGPSNGGEPKQEMGTTCKSTGTFVASFVATQPEKPGSSEFKRPDDVHFKQPQEPVKIIIKKIGNAVIAEKKVELVEDSKKKVEPIVIQSKKTETFVVPSSKVETLVVPGQKTETIVIPAKKAETSKASGKAETSTGKTSGKAETSTSKTSGKAETSTNKTPGKAETSISKTPGKAETSTSKTPGKAETSTSKTSGKAETSSSKYAKHVEPPSQTKKPERTSGRTTKHAESSGRILKPTETYGRSAKTHDHHTDHKKKDGEHKHHMSKKAEQHLLDQKQLKLEQKVWKAHAIQQYDLVIERCMDYPLVSAQFLPLEITAETEEESAKEYATHTLLIGTRGVKKTTKKDNHLLYTHVPLPREVEVNEIDVSIEELGVPKVVQTVNHEGRISRARYMPQDPNIVATRSPDSNDAFIYDISKHSKPADTTCKADLVLRSHEKLGISLSWNPNRTGHLLTSSDDLTICLWDINKPPLLNNMLEPTIYTGHAQPPMDVAWNNQHIALFGSVSTGKFLLWDTRNRSNEPTIIAKAHNGHNVNCLAFHPYNVWLLVTGAADKTSVLWDWRWLKKPIHTFVKQAGEVWQIEWSPHQETVFATGCGGDRRVLLWDTSRIGRSQTEFEKQDGPPELLFIHGGHQSVITDFCWHPSSEWTMCSVSDNKILQIWEVNYRIKNDEFDVESDEEPVKTQETTSAGETAAGTESSTASTEGSTATAEGSTAATEGSTATAEGSTTATEGSTSTAEGSTTSTEGSTVATEGSTPATKCSTAATEGSATATKDSTAVTESSTTATEGSTAATEGSTAATGTSTAEPMDSTPAGDPAVTTAEKSSATAAKSDTDEPMEVSCSCNTATTTAGTSKTTSTNTSGNGETVTTTTTTEEPMDTSPPTAPVSTAVSTAISTAVTLVATPSGTSIPAPRSANQTAPITGTITITTGSSVTSAAVTMTTRKSEDSVKGGKRARK